MTNATNHLEEKIGGHLLGGTTWAKPAAIYVGLMTAVTDSEAATATEVSGGAYARVQHGPDGALWNTDSEGQWSNASSVTFPQPSGANWGTVTHYALFDAATGGNCLLIAALGTSATVNDGDPAPFFAAGELVINFQ